MSFFKKFQEKAGIISNIAKEYYDEGLTFATKEMEKEKIKESGLKELQAVNITSDIAVKKTTSVTNTKRGDTFYGLNFDSPDEQSETFTETLDAEPDEISEYEFMLKQARKRDQEYQRMLSENEDKIKQLLEEQTRYEEELNEK